MEARPSTNLLTQVDAIYWPSKRLPQAKLDAYAVACVEIVVKYSEQARGIYDEILRVWELPGCQIVINDWYMAKPDTRAWLSNLAQSTVKNQPWPSWPKSWLDTCVKLRDNSDCHELFKYVANFIEAGFNRKIDLENRTPKVLPSSSSYLVPAIFFCSVLKYTQKTRVHPNFPRAMTDDEFNGFYWFVSLMTSSPSTRIKRRLRREMVRTLKREGFTMRHDSKILKSAKIWYKCRVDPGSIESYIDELAKEDKYIERGNIETTIAPCDEATGYPRQWRK